MSNDKQGNKEPHTKVSDLDEPQRSTLLPMTQVITAAEKDEEELDEEEEADVEKIGVNGSHYIIKTSSIHFLVSFLFAILCLI
jgi:hypothetical protein